ncbi:MAG TPA: RNA pseudouridine synthase [Lacunisphaera sp.]|nr:RNA pseudouridine synthase [Lacunisphaera sp.]
MTEATPWPPPAPPLVDPAALRSWVMLDDERLLVLDKPGWLVCHPSKQGPWSSLAGAVREEFKPDAIRFVYRLDRETSGVIILGKTEAVARRLGRAIFDRKLGKFYVALLEGELAATTTIDQPLGPDTTVNVTVKSRVVAGGQPATTIVHPLVTGGGFTLAGIELLTGRKHQIRAHAEWLGHRVVGDKLYGPDPSLYKEFAIHGWTARHAALLPLTRQALHCAGIDLRPAGMDYLLRAPWPADLTRFAEARLGLTRAEAQALIDGFVAARLAA